MATSSKKSKSATPTFQRSLKLVQEFQSSLLDSQLKKGRDAFRDLRLITGEGGWIDAHAILLCSLSPFLAKCIESQGDCYLTRRTVHLPDFSITEIKNLIQLVYTGSVQLGSEDEVNHLRGILAFFEIEIQDDLSWIKVAKGGVAETANKTQDIRFHLKKEAQNSSSASGSRRVDKDGAKIASTSTGVRSHPNLRERKKKRRYNDSDYEPDTDEDEKKDISNQRYPPSSKVRKLSMTNTGNADRKDLNPTPMGKNALSTSDDDKDESVEVNYNNKNWLKEARKAAKTCPLCKIEHEGPDAVYAASLCLSKHGRVWCYFCFKVFTSGESLFEHYKKSHTQAGGENCLLCPFCDQTVPFTSVANHVINLHLTEPRDNSGGNKDNHKTATNSSFSPDQVNIYPGRGGPGRPKTATVQIDPEDLSKTDYQTGGNNPRTQHPKVDNVDGISSEQAGNQNKRYFTRLTRTGKLDQKI